MRARGSPQASGLLVALLCNLAMASSVPYREFELRLRSNESCQLSIDGRPHGELSRESALTLKLPPGEVLVECQSIQEPRRRYADFLLPSAIRHDTLLLSLSVEPPQPEPRTGQSAQRFSGRAEGVLDAELGALWMASASAAMSWTSARAYCERLGSGWQLPSASQLRSLAGTALLGQQARGSMWSNKRAGRDAAYVIDVRSGAWSAEVQQSRHGAWCLRLP